MSLQNSYIQWVLKTVLVYHIINIVGPVKTYPDISSVWIHLPYAPSKSGYFWICSLEWKIINLLQIRLTVDRVLSCTSNIWVINNHTFMFSSFVKSVANMDCLLLTISEKSSSPISSWSTKLNKKHTGMNKIIIISIKHLTDYVSQEIWEMQTRILTLLNAYISLNVGCENVVSHQDNVPLLIIFYCFHHFSTRPYVS